MGAEGAGGRVGDGKLCLVMGEGGRTAAEREAAEVDALGAPALSSSSSPSSSALSVS